MRSILTVLGELSVCMRSNSMKWVQTSKIHRPVTDGLSGADLRGTQ